ncbi:hypothetical protein OAK91_06645, partial [Planctomycetaceae bacterium]|nr:hypothetical protein [Planctomycetaceae bacterium]
ADRDSDGIFEFPPIVISVGVWNKGTQPFQPIRTEVQELLHAERNDEDYRKLRRRLSVNHIVDREQSGALRYRELTAHPSGLGKEPIRSQLLVNGVAVGSLQRPEQISGLSGAAQPLAQEYFARWDRQRLARDIYVMLYAFGGPNNGVYPAANYLSQDNSAFTLYSEDELRRMAQFAVNMVDHMDADNVVTIFEYDTNLADGWGLDDDPYSDSTDNQPADRKFAYGVEKMQLNFSEGLAIFAPATEDKDDTGMPKAKADHDGTEWDDSFNHQFLFVELQNSSNQTVAFNNDEWQLVVRPYYWATGTTKSQRDQQAGTAAGPERRLTIQSAAPSVGVGGINSFLTIGTVGNENNLNEVLPPAGASTPWTPGTGDSGPASFTVRPNLLGAADTAERIAPEIALTDGQYLDLLTDSNSYRLNEPGGANAYEDGARITPNASTDPSGKRLLEFSMEPDFSTNVYEVQVVLRRRAHPNRNSPDDGDSDFDDQSRDNPWIVADRYRIPLREFDLIDDETDASVIQGQLGNLTSRARWQPMYGNPVNDSFVEYYDSSSFIGNSLGNYNQGPNLTPNVPDPYTLWQPHNDRFFTSLAEVFNVPMYGPARMNDVDVAADDGADNLWSTNPYWTGPSVELGRVLTGSDGRDAKLDDEQTFGHIVLNPDEDNPDDGTVDNLWYRALEFMTVPTQQHVLGFNEVLGRSFTGATNADTVYREFGSINLNTVRDPEVFAAMLDEPDLVQLNNITSTTSAALTDLEHASNGTDPRRRDWWVSHLLNRDVGDPLINNATAQVLPLPGIPGISRPYRPLSYIGSKAAVASSAGDAINDTVLRKLRVTQGGGAMASSTTFQDRGQFEIGTLANHNSDDVDYAMRNRVLGKVMNHHTTTSNTFYVFLQVDFFEAKEVGSDVVRIGDKVNNSPAFRGFFVVDRAQAQEILEATDLPQLDTGTNKFLLHYNQNFNWRALVLHRQRLN